MRTVNGLVTMVLKLSLTRYGAFSGCRGAERGVEAAGAEGGGGGETGEREGERDEEGDGAVGGGHRRR